MTSSPGAEPAVAAPGAPGAPATDPPEPGRRTTLARAARPAAEAAPVLGLALVVGLTVAHHLTAPVPSDHMNYMEAASAVPDPGRADLWHQTLRIGLVLPMWAAQQAFGFSQAAYYAVPVLATVLLAVATYAVGRLLVGPVVGLGAALGLVGTTHLALDASAPLPDLLSAALLALAVATAIAVHQGRAAVTASPRRQAAVLLVTGLLLGWAYLTREYSVLVWPLVGLLLWRRVPWRRLGWLAGGAAAALALELGYGAVATGDPLARLRAVLGHGVGPVAPELAATYQDLPRSDYAGRLWELLGVVAEGTALRVALVVAVLGGLVFARRLWPVLVWMGLVWVPLTLLGGVLDPSAPRLRLQLVRYWFPMYPAIAVAATGALWLATVAVSVRLLRGRATVVPPVLAAVAVAAATLSVLVPAAQVWSQHPTVRSAGATELERLRDWLEVQGGDVPVLWADRRTARLVPLFTVGRWGGDPVWSGSVATWTPSGGQPAPGDTVVLYGTGDRPVCTRCKDAARDLLGDELTVPTSWRLLLETPDGDLQVWRVGEV